VSPTGLDTKQVNVLNQDLGNTQYESKLILSNLVLSDKGQFYCKAKYADNTDVESDRVNLFVQGEFISPVRLIYFKAIKKLIMLISHLLYQQFSIAASVVCYFYAFTCDEKFTMRRQFGVSALRWGGCLLSTQPFESLKLKITTPRIQVITRDTESEVGGVSFLHLCFQWWSSHNNMEIRKCRDT
jgi:hypothetical protein